MDAAHDWTPEAADAAARRAGLAGLTPRHWWVITRCREEAARTGRALTLGRVVELTGLGEAELRGLFPGRPEASIARIAGLAPPAGPGTAGTGVGNRRRRSHRWTS